MKVLGFSQDFTVCDRCGRTELKGTWAIETSTGELYRLGSSCIHKKFQMEAAEAKALIDNFKKAEKNARLYELHIAPLKASLAERLANTFTATYENLTDFGKSEWRKMEAHYNECIEYRMKKYKITGEPVETPSVPVEVG